MQSPLDHDKMILNRTIGMLLIVMMATGIIDAICILHFNLFTAYMTGTLILFGAQLTTGLGWDSQGAIALLAFAMGAASGGWLVRRRPAARAVADMLAIVACLIFCAAMTAGFVSTPIQPYLTIFLLSTAMGGQTSATRHIGIPDMLAPTATMVVHGLAYDSRIAGGHAERRFRRVGIIFALLIGASMGSGVAMWRIWAGLLLASVILTLAATMAYRWPPK